MAVQGPGNSSFEYLSILILKDLRNAEGRLRDPYETIYSSAEC